MRRAATAAAAILAGCAMALAGCTAEAGDTSPPTSTVPGRDGPALTWPSGVTPPEEPSSTASPTPPSTVSDGSGSTVNDRTDTAQTGKPTATTATTRSTAKPSRSAATTQPPTGSKSSEIPGGLTASQTAGAKAALSTYRRYARFVDAAGANPGKDWSKDTAQIFVPPLAAQFDSYFSETAKRGQRATGNLVVYPQVTKVSKSGGEVTITACVDSRGLDLLDKTGKSILVPDAKGAYRVHPEVVIVTKFGANYLITKTTANRDVRCETG